MATQDNKIRAIAELMMERTIKYLECAIADAKRAGLADVNDPQEAARQACAFVMGAMLVAKIRNDIEVLKNLETGIRCIIGCKEAVTQ